MPPTYKKDNVLWKFQSGQTLQDSDLLNNLSLSQFSEQQVMVCVPCIVIPVLLYIWHRWRVFKQISPNSKFYDLSFRCKFRWLQPIALKIWNPWAKVECHVSKNLSAAMQFSFITEPAGWKCQRRRGRWREQCFISACFLPFYWYPIFDFDGWYNL